MGAKLETKHGETVDEYWGDGISKQLSKEFPVPADLDDKPLLVCAMTEDYWLAVQPNSLRQFRPMLVLFEGANPENTGRGRGLFVRHCIKVKAQEVEQVKDFD